MCKLLLNAGYPASGTTSLYYTLWSNKYGHGGGVKEGGLVWNKEWKWEEGERERERRRGKLGRDDSAREDSRIVAFILKEPRMPSSRTVSLITTCSHHSAHLQKHFFIPTLYVHV